MKSWVLNVKTVTEKGKQGCSLFFSSLWNRSIPHSNVEFSIKWSVSCCIGQCCAAFRIELRVLYKYYLNWGNNQDTTMTAIQIEMYIYAFSRRFYPKRLIVHLGYTFFCQYLYSLGIEPTTLCAANAMLYHWVTGINEFKLNWNKM